MEFADNAEFFREFVHVASGNQLDFYICKGFFTYSKDFDRSDFFRVADYVRGGFVSFFRARVQDFFGFLGRLELHYFSTLFTPHFWFTILFYYSVG